MSLHNPGLTWFSSQFMKIDASSLIPFCYRLSHSTGRKLNQRTSTSKTQNLSVSGAGKFIQTFLFVPPGVEPHEVNEDKILPGSNIVVGPYAGDARIKEVEFVKSSGRAKDCPKDDRPEFAILGRSNVGKSSLINALVRKKEIALTSKKPGFILFYVNFLYYCGFFELLQYLR